MHGGDGTTCEGSEEASESSEEEANGSEEDGDRVDSGKSAVVADAEWIASWFGLAKNASQKHCQTSHHFRLYDS